MNIRIIAALFALLAMPLNGQVLEVTTTGTITQARGLDSSVEVGTPFTYYFVH